MAAASSSSSPPSEPVKAPPLRIEHYEDNADALVYDASFETNPMPKHVPHVNELGVTSSPLMAAAFHISKYCQDYTDDFLLCRGENENPEHCLKEGRRVTRCATDFINTMKGHCAVQFAAQWQCLERRNQEYRHCRGPETRYNACVFDKMGIEKTIPGAIGVPIHLRDYKTVYHKTKEI